MNNEEKPYLDKVVIEKIYNPNYGYDRVCVCGHAYYRHFDTYDDMRNVGCKYCDCHDFQEKPSGLLVRDWDHMDIFCDCDYSILEHPPECHLSYSEERELPRYSEEEYGRRALELEKRRLKCWGKA